MSLFSYAVSPTGWGARINYDTWNATPWHPDKWVIHWPGTSALSSDPKVALQGIEKFHIDTQGWLGIAYNYAIDKAGVVYRLRGENRSGATSGDYESDGIPENHEARAVLFLITTGETPTAAQYDAFRKMHAGQPMLVIGHRDVFKQSGSGTSTSCPGDALAAFAATMNEEDEVPIYRTVLNVPDAQWARDVVDFHIDTSKVIVTTDSGVDDWNTDLADGRFWTLLKRYHDNMVGPLVARIVALEARVTALEGGGGAHDHSAESWFVDHRHKGVTSGTVKT